MHIVVYKNQCFNVDDGAEFERLLQKGARELTAEEIRQYGMGGYERFVSPTNTVVNADGSVTFTPPDVAALEKDARRQEIHAELDRIDRASARSLRAILAAQIEGKEPVNADMQMLATYEAEAVALREELQGLK